MNSSHLLESDAFSNASHLRIAQNATAVKNIDMAYTSASTAENQKVSEKAKASDPVTPEPINTSASLAWRSKCSALRILEARSTMLQ